MALKSTPLKKDFQLHDLSCLSTGFLTLDLSRVQKEARQNAAFSSPRGEPGQEWFSKEVDLPAKLQVRCPESSRGRRHHQAGGASTSQRR